VKLRWPHRLQICVPSQQRAPNAVSTFDVCFLKSLVAAGQALNAQRNQQMSAPHWVRRTTTVEPGQFHGGIVEIERPRAVASNLQIELAILTMLLQHNSRCGFERQRNNLSVTSAGDEVARLKRFIPTSSDPTG